MITVTVTVGCDRHWHAGGAPARHAGPLAVPVTVRSVTVTATASWARARPPAAALQVRPGWAPWAAAGPGFKFKLCQ